MRARGAAGILLIFLLIGCSQEKEVAKPAPASPILKIAYRGVIGTLDPITENTAISNSIYSNIFEPLVERDSDLKIVPALAVDWVNPDDRTWIFHLRPGVHFHDGTLLRADDVKFSLERVRQDPASMLASSISMIDKVDVVDERTIKIVTRKPFSILLTKLVDVWILNKAYFSKTHTGEDIPPGTGPYRVQSWQAGKQVRLIANPSYWEGQPPINEVWFDAVPDFETRIKGLLNHEIDILPALEPSALAYEANFRKNNIRILSSPGLTVLMLGMDQHNAKAQFSDAPQNPFKDIRVRKAVYEAINIDHIVKDILKGYALKATQLAAPKVFGFNENIQRLPYDPEDAKKLLQEAGYPKGFTVRLDTTNDRYRNDAEIGRSIAEDLLKVGIHVTLNQQPFEILFRDPERGRASFYLIGWVLPSTDASGALDFLVHSVDTTQGFGSENKGGYSNADLDRLIEQCDATINPDKRGQMLEQIMEKAMADFPYIPLHVESNISASSSRVQWTPRPDEYLYVKSMHFL